MSLPDDIPLQRYLFPFIGFEFYDSFKILRVSVAPFSTHLNPSTLVTRFPVLLNIEYRIGKRENLFNVLSRCASDEKCLYTRKNIHKNRIYMRNKVLKHKFEASWRISRRVASKREDLNFIITRCTILRSDIILPLHDMSSNRASRQIP